MATSGYAELLERALNAALASGGELDLDTAHHNQRWLSRTAYEAACTEVGVEPNPDNKVGQARYLVGFRDTSRRVRADLDLLRDEAISLAERLRASEEGVKGFDLERAQYWWTEGMDVPGGDFITYPGDLPSELEGWYAYVVDGGHCIGVVLKGRVKAREHLDLSDDVVGVPVRTVKRVGWEITPLGFVLVDLPYHPVFGAEVPEGDEELSRHGHDEDEDEDEEYGGYDEEGEIYEDDEYDEDEDED